MSIGGPTLGKALRVSEQIRAATAMLSLITARQGKSDENRDESLAYLARIQYLAAAPTLVIELARGTPLAEDRGWIADVCRLVAADERIADVAPRLAGRFLGEVRVPGSAPLLDASMVERILDAESANVAEINEQISDIMSHATGILAKLED